MEIKRNQKRRWKRLTASEIGKPRKDVLFQVKKYFKEEKEISWVKC